LRVSEVECVVFDFGGTFCSAPYFGTLGDEAPELVDRVLFGNAEISGPWMTERMSSSDIANYLSGHLQIPASEILAALRVGCRELELNHEVWSFAQEQHRVGRMAALVTGNADVFTDVVVPSHGLDQVFDVIVNSADHGDGAKEALWPKAFEALGPELGYHNSLLIEDSLGEVERFRSLGGLAYQYVGEESFFRWRGAVGL
jgi:FMN phosphatase YigB (HAD superfamily)